MKKSLQILAVGGALFGAFIVPAVPVALDCNLSFKANTYDTPSGRMEPGYWDADTPLPKTATSSELKLVKKTGEGAWSECTAQDGTKYLVPLTVVEYTDLSSPNAGKPQKTTSESLIQIIL